MRVFEVRRVFEGRKEELGLRVDIEDLLVTRGYTELGSRVEKSGGREKGRKKAELWG